MSLLTIEQASQLDTISIILLFATIHKEQQRLRNGDLKLNAFRHELWQEVNVTTLMGDFDKRVKSVCESFVESEIDSSRIPQNMSISTVMKHDTNLFAAVSIGKILKKFDNVTMYRKGQNYFIVGPDYTTVIHQPDYDFSEVGISEAEMKDALDRVVRNAIELVVCYGENFIQNMYTYLEVTHTGLDVQSQLDKETLASALDFLSKENVDTSNLRFIKTGESRHFFNQHVIISYCPQGYSESATVWPSSFKDAFDA